MRKKPHPVADFAAQSLIKTGRYSNKEISKLVSHTGFDISSMAVALRRPRQAPPASTPQRSVVQSVPDDVFGSVVTFVSNPRLTIRQIRKIMADKGTIVPFHTLRFMRGAFGVPSISSNLAMKAKEMFANGITVPDMHKFFSERGWKLSPDYFQTLKDIFEQQASLKRRAEKKPATEHKAVFKPGIATTKMLKGFVEKPVPARILKPKPFFVKKPAAPVAKPVPGKKPVFVKKPVPARKAGGALEKAVKKRPAGKPKPKIGRREAVRDAEILRLRQSFKQSLTTPDQIAKKHQLLLIEKNFITASLHGTSNGRARKRLLDQLGGIEIQLEAIDPLLPRGQK